MKLLIRNVTPPCRIKCVSDFHIGSPDVDYKALKKDIYSDDYDYLAINGDVFDAIVSSDAKRYSPSAIHKRLRGRDDVINGAVDWGMELLSGIRKSILFIADGNHERSAEKHGGVSVVKLLIDKLNDENAAISYGGYNGFCTIKSSGLNYPIYYHHGSGSGASLASAVSNTIKKMEFIDAKAIWLGHRHHRVATHLCRLGAKGRYHDVHLFMTGAYMRTYREGRESYASRSGLPPQGIGGVILELGRDSVKIVL